MNTLRLRPRSTVAVDRHVGVRMRERRIMLGLTQQQLAELIGVTYQQAHKYEKGVNRIAAGRLHNIAQALGVDISYFFEGVSSYPERPPAPTPHQRMMLDLGQNFTKLSAEHKQAVLKLARALADGCE